VGVKSQRDLAAGKAEVIQVKEVGNIGLTEVVPIWNFYLSKTLRQEGDVKMNRLMAVKEAALYTGLSPDTLYTMVSQRRVPFVKLGGALRFNPDQLDQWIKQNTVMPMPEKRY